MPAETGSADISRPKSGFVPYVVVVALCCLLLLIANTVGGGEFSWRHLLSLGVILLAAVAAAYVLGFTEKPRLGKSFTIALGVFTALLLLSALSLTWAASPWGSLPNIILTFTYLASFALAYLLLRGRTLLWVFMGGIAVVSVSLCVYGLMQYFFELSRMPPFLSEYGIGYELTDRVFARFSSPNTLAGFLALAIPLTLALFLTEKRSVVRLLWTGTLVLQFTCLYLTQSRGGWITVAVVLILMAFLIPRGVWRESWKLLAVIVVLAVALSFLSALYDPFGADAVDGGGGTSYSGVSVAATAGSLRGRLGIWRGGLSMFSHHLAGGVGAGSFWESMQRYQYRAYYSTHAHNYLLETGAETGVPGLLLMLALSFFVLYRIRAVFKRKLAGEARVYAVALWAATAGFLFHNLADFTWYSPLVGAVFWLCAGALYALTDFGWGERLEQARCGQGEGPAGDHASKSDVAADRGEGSGQRAGSQTSAAEGTNADGRACVASGGSGATRLRSRGGRGKWASRPVPFALACFLLAAVVLAAGYFLVLLFLAETCEERGEEEVFYGETRKAVESYRSSLAFWELSPRTHKELAYAYRELFIASPEDPARTEYAANGLEHCDRAIELDPGDAFKHHDKGIFLLYMEEYEQGRLHIEEAQRLYPNNPAPFLNEGRAFIQEGRTQEAEECFLEALRLLPYYTDPNIVPFRESNGLEVVLTALMEVAQLRVAQGDYRGAVDAIDGAVAELPGEPYLFHLRGWVYSQEGDLERALEDYERTAAIDPDRPGIHLEIGKIYQQLGDLDAARREFELELEVNPSSQEAAESLRSLEEAGQLP